MKLYLDSKTCWLNMISRDDNRECHVVEFLRKGDGFKIQWGTILSSEVSKMEIAPRNLKESTGPSIQRALNGAQFL